MQGRGPAGPPAFAPTHRGFLRSSAIPDRAPLRHILGSAPQADGMFGVIDVFHRVMDGRLESPAAAGLLAPYHPAGACDGYWHARSGMDRVHT